MTPITFNGCFGWLHPGTATRGIVLCSSFGGEETHMHGAWRKLAEQLADAGIPALRFDYQGTGDSIEDDEAPGRVRAWLDSVAAAVEWLKDNAGVKEVGLVGLSLGALVAAAAAEELGGVDALALLAPPDRKTYMRTLRAFDLTVEQCAETQAPGYVEARGFVYTKETISDIENVLFRNLPHPANRALIVNCEGIPADADLASSMRREGVEVREERFPEFRYVAEYPRELSDAVIDWMGHGLPRSTGTAQGYSGQAHIELPGARETALFFGTPSPLFGVLCKPYTGRPDLPVPVFINIAPGLHHIGAYRLWVTMARRFAEFGFTSLRIDVGGMGDTPFPGEYVPVPHSPIPRAEDSHGDMKTALDWLEGEGYCHTVLVGHCWSARLAYQVSAVDSRVVGQVLINPPRLRLPDTEKAGIGQSHDLSKRSVNSLLVFNADDHGLKDLERSIAEKYAEANGAGSTRIEVLGNADHLFQKREARHRLIASVLDYMVSEYLPSLKDSTNALIPGSLPETTQMEDMINESSAKRGRDTSRTVGMDSWARGS